MEKLSNLPPKGSADWLPEEFKIRKYIFDTWREVCLSFGYKEYLTPILETAAIYKAKSGEDVGGKELMTIVDRGGRELAIRPEMTPSVTRLVTRIYESTPKPIRLFSIANFYRNEKPQRGRNREFWQLNYDIFGATDQQADIEALQISLEIMLKFNPPKGAFAVAINSRELINEVLDVVIKIPDAIRTDVIRAMDKWGKVDETTMNSWLQELGLNKGQAEILIKFLNAEKLADLVELAPEMKDSQALSRINETLNTLNELGYGEWVEFRPNLIRGFDYYDGVIFEVFDNDPENKRSMFGGGRYNGLASLFGKANIPAVGAAPGDETTYLFLQSWGLTKNIAATDEQLVYLPLLDGKLQLPTQRLLRKLRQNGNRVEYSIETTDVGRSISYALKQGIKKVAILGQEELDKGVYKIKDLETRVETEFPL